MPKKAIFTILGMMLAVIAASITLVFTVGPRVSANPVLSFPNKYWIKSGDGTVYHFITKEGYDYIVNNCHFFYTNNPALLNVTIPNGVIRIENLFTYQVENNVAGMVQDLFIG